MQQKPTKKMEKEEEKMLAKAESDEEYYWNFRWGESRAHELLVISWSFKNIQFHGMDTTDVGRFAHTCTRYERCALRPYKHRGPVDINTVQWK